MSQYQPRPIKLTEADKIRFWEKIDRRGPDNCWEWQAARHQRGYGLFKLNGLMYRAHRVAFAVTNGDTNLLVCHTCDNPPCCNPNHLYAGTAYDNHCDCLNRGRDADRRGEKSGNVKLTESDVCEIRRLYTDGWLQCKIAEEYGISRQHVSRICRGKRWKHI